MKLTQVTELLANLKATFVSFFSIMMFVALGVGIFAGINWTSPALQRAADAAFEEGSLHHFQITYPYGLTDDDLAQLEALDGVSCVEGVRQSYQECEVEEGVFIIKVQGLSDETNVVSVVEGKLPEREDEIAISTMFALRSKLGVGDTVVFFPDGEGNEESSSDADAGDDKMQYLKNETFRITAVVKSPEYLASSTRALGYAPNGPVDAVAWVLPNAFKSDAFIDGYPVANVRCDDLVGLNTFSERYHQQVSASEQAINDLGLKLAPARFDSIRGDAQAEIDDAQAQLDDAQKEVNDAQGEIDSGEQEIEEKTAELEDAKAQLAEGEEQLESGRAQIAQAESELAAAYNKLVSYQAKYDEAVANINQAGAALKDLESAVALGRAAQQEADTELAEFTAALDEQLAAGAITQEEYDAQLSEAQQAHDAALLESNAALDEVCARAASEYAALMGTSVPAVDHSNVDEFLSQAKQDLDGAYDKPVDMNGTSTTLNKAKAELSSGWQQYYDGQAKLGAAYAQEQEAIQQLDEGRAKVDQGEQELADAREQLDDAKDKLADGKKEIEDKTADLQDAKASLDSMKNYNWTVSNRTYNGGVVEASTLSGMTRRLARSMAVLFVIVGLLVSYSAVSRIVHEQITQIGTKKALGLREREITTSFLTYSAIAVIVGSVIGLVVGVTAVEGIINRTLTSRFVMGAYPSYFGAPLALGISLLEMALVLGATILACRRVLRQHAIDLLNGEKPPEAKRRFYEKWAVWDRLPLFSQTIVNNCMNDKRRVFSTIVGVAGSTALIVTAITLNDDVLASFDKQYERVYGYNAVVSVDASVDDAANNIDALLHEEGAKTAQVLRRGSSITKPDGSRAAAFIVVPEDGKTFSQLYHVNPIDGGTFDLDGDGAWVTRAYAKHVGANVGDELIVDVGDGRQYGVTIAGFYDFYFVYNEIVMGKTAYENVFGVEAEPDTLLVDTGDVPVEAIDASLEGTPGLDSVVDDKASKFVSFDDFASLSRTVVMVYLVLAILMAIVVLLNLNVMFIEEKKRDLIVLMINGFSVSYAKKYIYKDTIVLTVLGILLGLLIGGIMGAVTVGSVEPETACFFKGIAWRAMAVGAGGSAILSFVMSAIALRRVSRFSLTDINKC